jgi:uncharacterized protein YbaR (Trm112 family)
VAVAGTRLTEPAYPAKFKEVQQLAYAERMHHRPPEWMHHRPPLWADGEISNHPATPGLWVGGPHIGSRDAGVEYEEILVVTHCGDAYRLDDDLPRMRRWQQAAATS